MPELPEVEVVRRGLDRHVVGRRIDDVVVHHPRPVRRHLAGRADFAAQLAGLRVTAAVRRGKFLWLPLAHPEDIPLGDDQAQFALIGHLGMSGQLLVKRPETAPSRHLRVQFRLDDASELWFVDQRMFGGVWLTTLAPTPDGLPAGAGSASPLIPPEVAHIGRDALDPHLDSVDAARRLRGKRTGVKRALLDQTLVSGIGNIYADEALWRARLHYDRPADSLSQRTVVDLLGHVRDVMRQALTEGGTTFDDMYVNVNGESGYFERSLAAYGQQGRPCARCGTPIRREHFMNRSSFLCPRCQPAPRSRRVAGG